MSDKPFEGIYCAEQINIPVTFPHILKSYTKAAIRTQPYDLLRWTSAYFRALANGEVPPMKERFEYPPFTHPTGLSPRYLKTLLNQLDHINSSSTSLTNRITLKSLLDCWQGIVLSEIVLYQILMVGRLLNNDSKHYELDLYQFLAVACGLISNNLSETMTRICELFTDEPDGGSAMIPLKIFLNLYEYLAKLNCSGDEFKAEISLIQNIEIASESLNSVESSILNSDEKNLLPSCSISIEDLRSVCTYNESDKSELISDDMSEYCSTIVSDNKMNNDNVICENGLRWNDVNKKYVPVMDDETSMKFVMMEEVMRIQDNICDDTDEEFDDTVVKAIAVVDEYAINDKDHENSKNLLGSQIILGSSTANMTNETVDKDHNIENIETDLSMSFTENLAFDLQVGGDSVTSGESNVNVTGDKKLVEMVDEVVEVGKGKKHIVIDIMEKQKSKPKQQQREQLNVKNILGKTCRCNEELERLKEIKKVEIGHTELQLSNYKRQLEMISSYDKVTKFIQIMEETAPRINYNVVGIGAVVSNERITEVALWLTECARRQGGQVGPRNLRHFLCPSLYDVDINNADSKNNNDDHNVSNDGEDDINDPHKVETN